MKYFKTKWVLPLFLLLCSEAVAQQDQFYRGGLRLQYGLYQYNNQQDGFISNDGNSFLSLGIGYRLQLSRVLGFNPAARVYQWRLPNNHTLHTQAVQAAWTAQLPVISSGYLLNRVMPYVSAGLGYEWHQLKS